MWWNFSLRLPKNARAVSLGNCSAGAKAAALSFLLLCGLPHPARADPAPGVILEQEIIVEERRPQPLQPLRPEIRLSLPTQKQTTGPVRPPARPRAQPSPVVIEYLLDSVDLHTLSPHAGLLALPRMISPELALALRQGRVVPPAQWEALIVEAARRYALPPSLIAAVIKTESNFQADAVSRKGAQGLMQLMPATQRHLGVTDPFDPRANILAGCAYLRRQMDRFGSLDLALAAYNAGPENVARYQGIPPFAETRNFVLRVRRYMGETTP